MFDKYSYKTKFKALLLIFCMLSFAAYKRSFSTLKDLVFENRELSKKEKTLKEGAKDVNKLSAEVAAIDKIIGGDNVDKEKIQQDIISFTTKYPVSIFDMKSIHKFSDESHTIYTHEIDITGSLNQLLALSYDFERKFNYSRMVGLKFYTTKKDNKSDILHLKMIFQNYENNK